MRLTELSRSLIQPGNIVFDIGAHDGGTAFPFASLVGPQGRVYAFEANPIYFFSLALRAAAEFPGLVRPYCRAIASTKGHLPMYSTKDFSNPNYKQASTIAVAEATTSRLGADFIKFMIESETLDNFCTDLRVAPHFIKIDVEGAEDQVFRGAEKTLRSVKPYVYYECGWDAATSSRYHHELLEALGYQLYVADIMHHAGRWSTGDARYLLPELLPITCAELSTIKTILINMVAVPSHLAGAAETKVALGTRRFVDVLRTIV
jgi:FkbM family methyltransferase